MRGKDESGKKYDLLTVISECSERLPNGSIAWFCKCDCGKEVKVSGETLRNGRSGSCGCRRIKKFIAQNTTHGMAGSRVYVTWQTMKHRCSPTSTGKDRRLYYGKGVRVCSEWQSFENFLSDMGDRPKGTSLDRIDSNGNYEPNNCRWATPVQQGRNTKRCVLTEDLAREIRELHQKGIPFKKLAELFSVRPNHILQVVEGKIWNNVDGKEDP